MSQHSTGRLTRNLASNVGSLGVSLAVGFLYTPYLIHRLGPAAYGIIPLATTLVSYLSLVTVGLNTSVGRYLTVALEKPDIEEANRVFNTSVIGAFCAVALLSIPAYFIVTHLGTLVRLPEGQLREAQLLFLCAACAFLIATMTSSFQISCFARNRFDIQGAINVGETMLRVFLVLLLFAVAGPNLRFVGLALLVASLLTLGNSIWAWSRLTPELKLGARYFRTGTLRGMLGTSWWTLVNHLGSLLFLNIDLILANRMFGPDQAGRYAPLLQWSAVLRSLAGVVGAVFYPTILSLYAKDKVVEMTEYANQAMRLIGILLAFPIGLIAGFAPSLLSLWLGRSYRELWPLLSLLVLPLSVNLAVLPLFGINTALNRIRTPGLVTLVLGATNLLLALFLAGALHWGLYGLAAAGALVLTCKNVVFLPIYCSNLLGLPKSTFFRVLWVSPVLSGLLAVTAFCISESVGIASWPMLIGWASLLSLLLGTCVFRFVMTEGERNFCLGLLRKWSPFQLEAVSAAAAGAAVDTEEKPL